MYWESSHHSTLNQLEDTFQLKAGLARLQVLAGHSIRNINIFPELGDNFLAVELLGSSDKVL